MHKSWFAALVLTTAAYSFASAGVPACPELHVAASIDFPAGQYAASTMGASTTVPPPTRHVAVPDGPLASVSITMGRGVCYGTCPSYSVVMRGDGSASYDGKAHVLVPGHHDFTIPKETVDCLLTQFRRADFWSLADDYSADITDGPQYQVTLTIGGKSKTLNDYFGTSVGMPLVVTVLEKEIDRVAADRWVKGTDDTLPSLRKERFDLHSAAAATILANGAAEAPEGLIKGMIEAGTPVTGRRSKLFGRDGATAVEMASYGGRAAIVEALIARGALSSASQSVKNNALQNAAASGNPRVVTDILAVKPDVNARDSQGNTALIRMWGARRFAKDQTKVDLPVVTKLLLAAGADPNVADQHGDTALFDASDATVVKLLVAAGAKVNTRNKYGSTPLLYTSSDGAAVALIEAGADTSAKDNFGDTIEKRAASKKFEDTLRLLREKR